MSLEHILGNPVYLFYVVVAACLIIVTVCFVMLVSSVVSFLKKMRRSLALVDERLHQIEPILEGARKVEENLNEIIGDAAVHVETIQQEASMVMSSVTETLSTLRKLEQRLEEGVPPILEETRELVTGVNEIAHDVERKVRAADELFEAVEETGQTVRMVTGIVRSGFSGLAVQLASLAVGMKASLEYVTDNIHKGGEDK